MQEKVPQSSPIHHISCPLAWSYVPPRKTLEDAKRIDMLNDHREPISNYSNIHKLPKHPELISAFYVVAL